MFLGLTAPEHPTHTGTWAPPPDLRASEEAAMCFPRFSTEDLVFKPQHFLLSLHFFSSSSFLPLPFSLQFPSGSSPLYFA